MNEIVKKAMRLQKPLELKISLRRCVYEWLLEVSKQHGTSENVYVRGLVEDAYDRAMTIVEDPDHG